MGTWREELGLQIREARIARGLTQAAVANSCSITRVTMNKIEKGHAAPDVELLAILSATLGGANFHVRGIRIGGPEAMSPISVMPSAQMTLPFGSEYCFTVASIRMDADPVNGFALTLQLSKMAAA